MTKASLERSNTPWQAKLILHVRHLNSELVERKAYVICVCVRECVRMLVTVAGDIQAL